MFTHPRRHIQVVSTARRLLSLKLAPEVCQHLYGVLHRDHQTGTLELTGSEVAGALPADLQTGRSQTRGHLLLLFSAVCRCISSNNPMLRDSLRQVSPSVTLCLPTGLSRSLPLPLALWSPCVLESAWLAALMPVQRLYFCFLRVHSVVVANPRNLPTALLFLLQILEVIGRELSLPAASDIVLSH